MTPKRAEEIVSQFSGKKILVVGDVVIDHYVHGVVERLNPEAPVPILEAREEHEATGGAGNTAKNLAQLGADTVVVGVVGKDEGASRYRALAEKEGYRPVVIEDISRPTTRKVRHIVNSQQLLRVDYEKVANVSEQVEDEIIEAIKHEVKQGAQAILVSDYAKGVVTRRVAETVMDAKRNGIFVAADIKPSRAPYFIGVDFISPNRKEAHEILALNQHEQGGRQAKELAHLLQEKMQCDVYVTLSADGVYVLTKDGVEKHVPQDHRVEVFDPSGAGDTSAATMTLAYLAGATPEEVAILSNAAGAVVVQKVGSVGLTQQELLNMLEHRHE
ncbi:MAG: PfkB family carbohydrate kinase [Candidatus Andersenbacteria bacterium]